LSTNKQHTRSQAVTRLQHAPGRAPAGRHRPGLSLLPTRAPNQLVFNSPWVVAARLHKSPYHDTNKCMTVGLVSIISSHGVGCCESEKDRRERITRMKRASLAQRARVCLCLMRTFIGTWIMSIVSEVEGM
jgi:hypothetical protein